MGNTTASPAPDLLSTLHRYWGYETFRPLQERIVHSLLAGRDAAIIMPTGGGKSLCYQLPAVVSGQTVVVISPLIALMQDQVVQLKQMDIPAAFVNSAISLPRSHSSPLCRKRILVGIRRAKPHGTLTRNSAELFQGGPT